MQRFILLCVILFTLNVTGQNYQAFTDTSSLLFANSVDSDETFGLAFDSVMVINNETHFYPYMQLGSQYQTSVCPYWGNPYCIVQDKPGWLGKKIISTSDHKYGFIRKGNDTIWMDLGLGPQDSSLVYQDAQQNIWMKYDSKIQDSVAGTLDSVKVFLLRHYNNSGQVITSGYHNDSLLIGKTTGLIQLMQIDTFPAKRPMLSIVAHSGTGFGLTHITEASLHDHQVGDEIQYHDFMYSYLYGPNNGHNRYKKFIYLQRTNSPGSVTYVVRTEEFDHGGTVMQTDTVSMTYSKTLVFAQLPYDRIDQSSQLKNTNIYKEDYCGTRRWTYSVNSHHPYFYCPFERSWCEYDYGGPPPTESFTYVLGLGLYDYEWSVIAPNGGWGYNKIIWYRKNGVDCGYGAILNQNEGEHKDDLRIYPNPAGNQVTIDISSISRESSNSLVVEILNNSGKLLIREEVTSDRDQLVINTTELVAGMYLVRIQTEGTNGFRKLIIQ